VLNKSFGGLNEVGQFEKLSHLISVAENGYIVRKVNDGAMTPLSYGAVASLAECENSAVSVQSLR
jgi:hypothetical protein